MPQPRLSRLHISVRCTTSRSRGCKGRKQTRPRALSAPHATFGTISTHDYLRSPTRDGGVFLTVPSCFGICHDHSRLSLAFCFTGGCIATASRIQAFSDFIIITMGRQSSFIVISTKLECFWGCYFVFSSWAGCLNFQIAKSFCFLRYIDDDD
jgi:hypothetical protein